MVDWIFALFQPPWPVGYYIIVFCLIGSTLDRAGVSHGTSLIVAGVLCIPIGWIVSRLAGRFFKRLVDKLLAPNKNRLARSRPDIHP
jgi:hypothetical protein